MSIRDVFRLLDDEALAGEKNNGDKIHGFVYAGNFRDARKEIIFCR